MLVYRDIYVIFLLSITCWETSGITNKRSFPQQDSYVRNFRQTDGVFSATDLADWEIGLRESVNQALLREGFHDPNLKERLLRAPIIGKQNVASPFGDVVVLARGQLYGLNGGNFAFVQDPYTNDCDECHNTHRFKCNAYRCKNQRQPHKERLIALWTIKRLRHRIFDSYHYEIQYTISPTTPSIDEEFVTRNGGYDYTIPGHVFIIRNDNSYRQPEETYTEVYNKKHPAGHYKPEILIAVDEQGHKHFLHSYPGFFTSTPVHPTRQQDLSTNDPKEIYLYKKLIESLAEKTSTTTKEEMPHSIPFTHLDAITKPHFETHPTATKAMRPLTPIFMPTNEETKRPFTQAIEPSRVLTKTTTPRVSSEHETNLKTTFHYFMAFEDEPVTEEKLLKMTSIITSLTTATEPSRIKPMIPLTTREQYRPTKITTSVTSTTKTPSTEKSEQSSKATKKYIPGSTKITHLTEKVKMVTTVVTPTVKPLISEISLSELPTVTHEISSLKMSPSSISKEYSTTEKFTKASKPLENTSITTSSHKRPSKITKPTRKSTMTKRTRPTIQRGFGTKLTKPSGLAQITRVTKPEKSTTEHLTTKQSSIITTKTTMPISKVTPGYSTSFKTTSISVTTPLKEIAATDITAKVSRTTETTFKEFDQTTQVTTIQQPESPTQTELMTERSPPAISKPIDQIPTPTIPEITVPYTYFTTVSPEAITDVPTFFGMSTMKMNDATDTVFTSSKEETTHFTEKVPNQYSEQSFSLEGTTEKLPMITLSLEQEINKPGTTLVSITETPEPVSETMSESIPTSTKYVVYPTYVTEYGETFEVIKPITIIETSVAPNTELDKETPTTFVPTSTTEISTSTTKLAASLQSTTSKKIISPTLTSTSDFLSNGISAKEPVIYVKPINQDYTDDDIFGTTKSTRKPTTTVAKKVSDSNFALELFSNRRNRKGTRASSKVIYSNFYPASTSPIPKQETTSLQPLTSQSIETSISYVVNKKKRNNVKTENFENSTTTNIEDHMNTKGSSEVTIVNDKKAFDLLALQLVNHARTIDYLKQTDSTVRPKYKRRRKNYNSKLRRNNFKRKQQS